MVQYFDLTTEKYSVNVKVTDGLDANGLFNIDLSWSWVSYIAYLLGVLVLGVRNTLHASCASSYIIKYLVSVKQTLYTINYNEVISYTHTILIIFHSEIL